LIAGRVHLENEHVKVTFLPEVGGKMVSLVHKATGREWLLPPQDHPYRPATTGDVFEDFDTSGFDECFPTISACRYPRGEFEGNVLPDHGELWSQPWMVKRRGDTVELSAACESLPAVLARTARLRGSAVVLEYELVSKAREAYHYLWSAHPLLQVEEGAELHLPPEVQDLSVNWSLGDRLGRPGDVVRWTPELARVGAPTSGRADKLYTGRLAQGWCGIRLPSTDSGLTFRFDPAAVPFVGLWICQGGWPTSRASKHYTVALEPCSARPDSLAEAIARGEAPVLPAGEILRWTLTIELHQGPPRGEP